MRFLTKRHFPHAIIGLLNRGVMFDINPRKSRQKKWIILTVIAVLVIVGVSFFGIRWWKDRKAVNYGAAQAQNPQTEEGNDSQSDESSSNTYQQNQVLESSSSPSPVAKVTLPTPLLMKSSGNNGAVPNGVEVEFTCVSQAGYKCKVVLSGTHAKTFDTKDLKDNGRGQASVSWLWTAEAGQHSVKAVLSDGKGNEQESSAQTLEVK